MYDKSWKIRRLIYRGHKQDAFQLLFLSHFLAGSFSASVATFQQHKSWKNSSSFVFCLSIFPFLSMLDYVDIGKYSAETSVSRIGKIVNVVVK